ncbi:MAG TPA: DMT family transporter [Gemmatimonadales bacterium]
MSPRLRILAAAVLFSTSGAAIKYLPLDAWQVAGFRGLVAGVAVLAMVPAARHYLNRKALVVGLGSCASTVLFAVANKLTTAASAIFLQSTSPVFTLLLAPLLVGERASRRDVGATIVMLAGMAVFFVGADHASASATDPILGNTLALISAVTWALTIIGYRWLGRDAADRQAAVVASAVAGNLLAFLVCLPLALPVTHFQVSDAAILLYLGVIQLAVAYVLMARAMPHVPALEASLLLLIEPVVSPVWAWMLVGELPGVWTIGGGAIILGATIWKARRSAEAVPLAD